MRDATQDPQVEDLCLLRMGEGLPHLVTVLSRTVKMVDFRVLWPAHGGGPARVRRLRIGAWREAAVYHVDRPQRGEVLLHCFPDPRGAYVVSETRLDRLLTIASGELIRVQVTDPHLKHGLDLRFSWAPPCFAVLPVAPEGDAPPPWPVVVEPFNYGFLAVVNAPVGAEVHIGAIIQAEQ